MMKNFLCIGDHGLDPDDVVNAVMMTRLRQRGESDVLGFVANYSPSIERAKLLKSILLSLGSTIPVAIGSNCNAVHTPRPYEFDFPHREGTLLSGYNFMITSLARVPDRSVTLLLHSGLTDVAFMIDKYPALLQKSLAEVYIMGGASWEGDRMVVDRTASNNKFDKTLDPQRVYDFFIDSGIPLNVLTRDAAYSSAVGPGFYESLGGVNEPCKYLFRIQKKAIKALWGYARNNPPTERQNAEWFSKTFCDCPLDPSTEDPWPFVKRLSLYDPITTVWALHPEWFSTATRSLGGVRHSICSKVLAPEKVIQFISDRLK